MADLLRIRAATVADAGLLASWNSLPHVQAAVSDDGLTGFDCDWSEELLPRDDGSAYFVAEADGRPIGAMQIIDPARDETHYWGEIAPDLRAIDIWIGDPEYLGRGFGTRMMRWALARCFAEPAVTAVLVDPLFRNTRAHRFYQRLGFRPVERRRFDDTSDCLVLRLERAAWAPSAG
jgi:aminoglycoside 6'-N-acetyltransferase